MLQVCTVLFLRLQGSSRVWPWYLCLRTFVGGDRCSGEGSPSPSPVLLLLVPKVGVSPRTVSYLCRLPVSAILLFVCPRLLRFLSLFLSCGGYFKCFDHQRFVEFFAGDVGLFGRRMWRSYGHRRPNSPPGHAGWKTASQRSRNSTDVLGDAEGHRERGSRSDRIGHAEGGRVRRVAETCVQHA